MNKEKNFVGEVAPNRYAERRTSLRIEVELSVNLHTDEKELGAYAASNVSAGGLCLRGNFKSIFPGDVLNVNFIDTANDDYRLSDVRALVLNRNADEGHLTWLDCDSLFWVKLLKLLACATNDTHTGLTPEELLRDVNNR